jgi:hypothetical protein
VKNQSQTISELSESKKKLENDLAKTLMELNEVKEKFESSANLIQHTFKTGALIKEEKDSLEKILKDNAVKLRLMKEEYDKLSEAYSKNEARCFELQSDLEFTNKKNGELKKLNEILDCEKEACLKVCYLRLFKDQLKRVNKIIRSTRNLIKSKLT